MRKVFALLMFGCLVAARCPDTPMLASVGVTALSSADTTVKAIATCYPATGEAITTCRWQNTKGGASYPTSDGLTAVLQFTGQPNDPALFMVSAAAVRAGAVGPYSAPMAYWMKIANRPPSALDSIRIHVCGPPEC